MLRDDIKRLFQNFDRIECALAHELRGDGRFHEVVDIGGDENAVTIFVQRMPGPADALDGARNAFRRRHHHDQIDCANIDSELEAGRANDGPQFAVLQAIFNFEANAAIKRSMMNLDRIGQFRELLAQSQVRFVPPPSGHW